MAIRKKSKISPAKAKEKTVAAARTKIKTVSTQTAAKQSSEAAVKEKTSVSKPAAKKLEMLKAEPTSKILQAKPIAVKPQVTKKKTPAPPVKAAKQSSTTTAQRVGLSSETAVAKPAPQKKEGPAMKVQVPPKPAEAPKPSPKGSSPAQAQVAEESKPQKAAAPPIQIEMPITVGALARKLNIRVSELIKLLIGLGVFANVNQLLNEEIIRRVAGVLGVSIEKLEDKEAASILEDQEADSSQLELRPPVVTMMGHVDHGKTSLLDAIRSSDVASKEAGQITQHIGAYGVDIAGKGHVTFLDTPGHEAFTAMRSRGANVTDVVVLVVAADDGVKPQTIEAIAHARAAGCPIVVAMNKSDLPNANPDRVMAQLQKLDLMPEEWGGKTICVKVSAKTGTGISQLLELLLLEAEVLELKANPHRLAQGTVIEAKLTKGQGNVVTVLVQNGTLKTGDLIVVGPHYGKIRAMKNDRGKTVKEAKPSYAVEVLGLSGTPEAGEVFRVVPDEKTARKIAEKRLLELREKAIKGFHTKHLSLEDLYSQVQEGRVKELKLIVKADVQGSAEALTQSLEQASSEKIQIRVIHGGVGGINESDIMLATASDAIVIGFHVKPDERAEALAEKEGVDIRLYKIIYEAIEDVRKAMEGLLEPTLKEVVEGRTEIRQIFQSSKIGKIGGAWVQKGKIARNHQVRVLRNNIIVFEGKLSSLKRFKDDVREVQEGYDCGVVVSGFDALQVGDVIESYRIEKVAGKLT